ncbi:MAG: hypothetical protein AABX97_09790 [Candidatus Thermoplasmatota archaeon]
MQPSERRRILGLDRAVGFRALAMIALIVAEVLSDLFWGSL